MLGLIAWRLPQVAATLLILSLAAWFAIGLMPGDPVSLALTTDPRLTAADVARLTALYGLDQPLWTRWLSWAGGVLRGEFGYSRLFARPVVEVLLPALRSTLVLLGAALLLSAATGVALGALAALRPRWRVAVDTVAVLGQAAPVFWLAILAILLFAVTLGWLPAGGASDTGWPDEARFLLLPVTTLAVHGLAAYARHTASAMAEVLTQPFITAARARGAGGGRIAWRHAFPNAAVPVLAIAAVDVGALVSGALVTETVFARPGMGKLLFDAVMGNDYNLALLCLLLVAAVTMLATLLADLGQHALDPRLG
ncbi:ABC transporter permease [Roseomonas sp. BN140053]|uniref:ABC transporter permease n=1 Tax=Roseomonas sp. BN140053 TaxID=3391898 RepID=UPI0039ED7F38